MPLKLFVTGASGFIGSHFVEQAMLAGHQVVGLRRSPESKPRIPLTRDPTWVDKRLNDLTSTDFCGADCLVHLAAAGVSQTASWDCLFRTNVTDSLDCWLRAVESGVSRFVICGSCFEYGRSGNRFEFIPPDAPLEPVTPYAASKAAASMAALAMAADRKVCVQIARPFHVFGEGESENRLWPSLRRAALAGKDFALTPGEQVRDFIQVSDVARRLLEICHCDTLDRGTSTIENLGTGKPQTVLEFCQQWWRFWRASGNLLVGQIAYRDDEVMRYVPTTNA